MFAVDVVLAGWKKRDFCWFCRDGYLVFVSELIEILFFSGCDGFPPGEQRVWVLQKALRCGERAAGEAYATPKGHLHILGTWGGEMDAVWFCLFHSQHFFFFAFLAEFLGQLQALPVLSFPPNPHTREPLSLQKQTAVCAKQALYLPWALPVQSRAWWAEGWLLCTSWHSDSTGVGQQWMRPLCPTWARSTLVFFLA